MRVAVYILCFFAFFILSTGIMFKIMHWPGSSFMLVAGYLFSTIAALFLLIHKYKSN